MEKETKERKKLGPPKALKRPDCLSGFPLYSPDSSKLKSGITLGIENFQ